MPGLPLNANRVCGNCERGEHRLCRNAECECLAGTTPRHHANRPPRPKEPTMPEPAAAITPIGKKTKPDPRIELRKVAALPASKGRVSLTDRIIDVVEAGNIGDDSWYQVVAYPSTQGASNAVKWLRKNPRSAGWQFEARDGVVYVRNVAG